jgi:hypothetical protein
MDVVDVVDVVDITAAPWGIATARRWRSRSIRSQSCRPESQNRHRESREASETIDS